MARSKKIRIIETSIERLGRILTEKWGIKVIFQGDRCETDGKTIYLPVIPDAASEEFLHAMQGRLDHEAAHCVYTDNDSFRRFMHRPKALTLLNAMEDPRVEKKWIRQYPGARLNLERLQDWACTKVAEEQEVDDGQGGKKKQRDWDCLSDFGKYILGSIAYLKYGPDHWFVKDVVEPPVMEQVLKTQDLFAQAQNMDSVQDVEKLVEEALTRLQVTDDPQDPQMSSSPPPDAQPGQDDTDPGAGAGGMPLDTEDDQGVSPQQQAMMKPSSNGSKQQTQRVMSQAEEKAQAEQDNKILNPASYLSKEAKNSFTNEDAYLVYSTEGDKIEKIEDGNRKEYGEFLKDAVRVVAPMKRRLSMALMARKESHWEEGKKRGKVNGRRIYRVVLNTGRDVFKQQVEGEKFDTCVLMAVDHSSSMSGSKLILAAQTATIFGELFHQIGIPFACYGFSTGDGSVGSARRSSASSEERSVYSRWGNLWLGEYKSFNDSWLKAGPKLLAMPNHMKHNTYDGESLKRCAQILLTRPESRKILFWLNDGEPCPNYGEPEQAHCNFARLCASEVEKMVEVIAIGIMTEAVKDFYSYWVRVSDISDLPKTCLAEIDSRLRVTKKLSKRAI